MAYYYQMNSLSICYSSVYSNEISFLKYNQIFKKQPILKPLKNTYSYSWSTLTSPPSIKKSNIHIKKYNNNAIKSDKRSIEKFLYPEKSELPENFEMPIWDHLEELRERVIMSVGVCIIAIITSFIFSKDLIVFLEAPVAAQGVRFLQLSPGEFFFTTLQVAGYAGLLISVPTVLYEIAAYLIPGLTKSERRFLAPIIFGSSVLFYIGLLFSYEILTPAALNFFVAYAEGAVESLWSIDQYFNFVLVLMLSTGLAFQVPVVQVLLGKTGIITSKQMFSQWRYVIVGATVAAAVLTPSTDPFTQTLLALPLISLYMGGAAIVQFLESGKKIEE